MFLFFIFRYLLTIICNHEAIPQSNFKILTSTITHSTSKIFGLFILNVPKIKRHIIKTPSLGNFQGLYMIEKEYNTRLARGGYTNINVWHIESGKKVESKHVQACVENYQNGACICVGDYTWQEK